MNRLFFRKFIGGLIFLLALGAVGGDIAVRSALFSTSYVIGFSRGINMSPLDEGNLEAVAREMQADPGLRAVITGHTGTLGDASANLALSRKRAESTVDALAALGVARDRIEMQGLGSSRPLDQGSDESDRSWQSRLARVEIELVQTRLQDLIPFLGGN